MPPRPNVVSVRLDDPALEAVDLLVQAGIAQSRSDAAAHLVTIGIGSAGNLLDHARRLAGSLGTVKDLLEAIKARDLDRVNALLERNRDLAHAAGESGETPMLLATYYGAKEVQDLLLARGVRLNLFEAAAVGKPERVRELLNAHPEDVHAYSHDGWTALHLAAHFGHEDVARLLLDMGANPGARSRNAMHNTAVHAALAGGHGAVARLLVERGADCNAADSHGWTPLHHAAHAGDAETVRFLLRHGADRDARKEGGQTALEVAVERGHDAVADILRGQGEIQQG